MPQAVPAPFRVTFVVASSSAIASLAAARFVDHGLHLPMGAFDIAATAGGLLVAGAFVYIAGRILLGPWNLRSRPLAPLSASALTELAVGVPAVLMIVIVAKVWLHVEMMLSVALLYAPLGFWWLRREFARQ